MLNDCSAWCCQSPCARHLAMIIESIRMTADESRLISASPRHRPLLQDMVSLQCLPPSAEPKATDFIPQMIATIQTIIDNGHGYAVDGDVFFDVPSLPDYGKLSGRAQEDNRCGSRVGEGGLGSSASFEVHMCVHMPLHRTSQG